MFHYIPQFICSLCLFFSFLFSSFALGGRIEGFSELFGREADEGLMQRIVGSYEAAVNAHTQEGITEDQAKYNWGHALFMGDGAWKEESLERLWAQEFAFSEVGVGDPALYAKTLYCRGIVKTRLAQHMKNPTVQSQFNQEAYYYLSMSGQKKAPLMMQQMVAQNRIAYVIGNPEMLGKFSGPTFKQIAEKVASVQTQFLLRQMCHAMTGKSLDDRLAAVVTQRLPGQADTARTLAGELGSTFRALMREKLTSAETVAELAGEVAGHVTQGTYQRDMENTLAQQVAARAAAGEAEALQTLKTAEKLTFRQGLFTHLTQVFCQLKMALMSTTHCPSGINPMVIVIGRSPAWLVKYNELLQGPYKIDMIHVLGTGLRLEEINAEQMASYHQYMRSLGIGALESEQTRRPILLLDVAETGRSLQRMAEILIQGFPGLKDRLQFLAMMYAPSTLNLPKSRVLYISSALSHVLFAKHSELAQMCPFPPLYPSQFSNWEKETTAFQAPAGARRLEAELKDLMARGDHLPLLTALSQVERAEEAASNI